MRESVLSGLRRKRVERTWFSMLSMSGKLGVLIVCIVILMGVVSLLFLGDLHRIPSGASLEAPSFHHLLGTDDLGIDLLAQLCHGALISIAVGFGSAVLAGIGGSLLGILAGYSGGWIDKVICALCDMMAVIPQLLLTIVLGAYFGPSLRNVILVIALLSWVGPARITRARTISLRNEPYVIASACYGASFLHIFRNHLLPSLLPIVMVSIIRIISRAIVTEAGITFLGLGDPTSKSWGVILNRAMNFRGIYFTEYWKWWILSPLAALTLLVLSIAWIARDMEHLANRKL